MRQDARRPGPVPANGRKVESYQVVRGTEAVMRGQLRDVTAVAAALSAPFLVALALVPVRTGVSHTNIALVLVVVTVAVSALGNRLAGAIAALSSAVWFDFFHTAPYQSFDIHGRGDLETAVLLLLVGLVVSQLAARSRLLGRVAVADAEHLDRLHETFDAARAGTQDAAGTVARIRADLVDVLDLRDCVFTAGPCPATGTTPPRLRADGSVQVEGWIWDVDRQGWPEEPTELRAEAGGRVLGTFLLVAAPDAVPAPLEARLVAADLACLAAYVLAAQDAPAAAETRSPSFARG
jgi:hypothetical protein